MPQNSSSPLAACQQVETSRPGFPQFERPRREFVLAQLFSFASAAEPPSFPRSLVRREQPQVDVNGHPPRSKKRTERLVEDGGAGNSPTALWGTKAVLGLAEVQGTGKLLLMGVRAGARDGRGYGGEENARATSLGGEFAAA